MMVVMRAFVFSGGASLGAIQVGMASALEEAGITPEMVAGSSVGAINGSWFAGGGDAAGLEKVWGSISRRTIFPTRPLLGLRAFLGRSDHFVPSTGLRRLLKKNVNFARLEDASIPFLAVATDVRTGDEVIMSTGDSIDAIIASASIPAVFAPAEIDGRLLIDGGIANNTPISTAIDAGATEVWVLSTGFSCAVAAPPTNALEMAMHSIALLVQQRLVLETTVRDYPVPVHLIPPPCPMVVSPIDFSQTSELIERARSGTREWLNNGKPPAHPQAVPHRHDV